MRTLAVVADITNLYFCIGKAFPGRKLDYGRYLLEASGSDATYRAYAFGTKRNDEAYPFIACLRHLGYETRFIPYVPRVNNNVAMATELFRIIKKLDYVVLGSSNPNLIPLIEWIKEQGVQVVVYACGIPNEVREAASKTREIDEGLLKDVITEATE